MCTFWTHCELVELVLFDTSSSLHVQYRTCIPPKHTQYFYFTVWILLSKTFDYFFQHYVRKTNKKMSFRTHLTVRTTPAEDEQNSIVLENPGEISITLKNKNKIK